MRITFNNQVPRAGRIPRAAFLSLAKTSAVVLRALRGTDLVSVNFVGTDESRRLNRTYRKKNRPTNVLSFVSESAGELGDIILCPKLAREEAAALGMGYGVWVNYLFVHGLLHLAGLDHITERDERAMEAAARKILGAAYPFSQQ